MVITDAIAHTNHTLARTATQRGGTRCVSFHWFAIALGCKECCHLALLAVLLLLRCEHHCACVRRIMLVMNQFVCENVHEQQSLRTCIAFLFRRAGPVS